jgi:xanthine dehydrogenase small subunit
VSAESELLGRSISSQTLARAQEALSHEIKPIDDMRSTALYRAHVARNLLSEFLLNPHDSQ